MSKTNMDYLNELINDHKTFKHLLEDIEDLIQAKGIKGIATHMDSLKNNLLAHIKKEDDKIYIDLLKVARDKNIELVELTISTFSNAMKGVATRILKFFYKYPQEDEIVRLATEFHKDFQGVYEDLLKRINNEEKVLYPMYKKYCC